MITSHKIAYTR